MLKNIPENANVRKEAVALLIKTLEGVKADASGTTVSGGVQFAAELTKVLVEFAEKYAAPSTPRANGIERD
jgi:hypothetical protein